MESFTATFDYYETSVKYLKQKTKQNKSYIKKYLSDLYDPQHKELILQIKNFSKLKKLSVNSLSKIYKYILTALNYINILDLLNFINNIARRSKKTIIIPNKNKYIFLFIHYLLNNLDYEPLKNSKYLNRSWLYIRWYRNNDLFLLHIFLFKALENKAELDIDEFIIFVKYLNNKIKIDNFPEILIIFMIELNNCKFTNFILSIFDKYNLFNKNIYLNYGDHMLLQFESIKILKFIKSHSYFYTIKMIGNYNNYLPEPLADLKKFLNVSILRNSFITAVYRGALKRNSFFDLLK